MPCVFSVSFYNSVSLFVCLETARSSAWPQRRSPWYQKGPFWDGPSALSRCQSREAPEIDGFDSVLWVVRARCSEVLQSIATQHRLQQLCVTAPSGWNPKSMAKFLHRSKKKALIVVQAPHTAFLFGVQRVLNDLHDALDSCETTPEQWASFLPVVLSTEDSYSRFELSSGGPSIAFSPDQGLTLLNRQIQTCKAASWHIPIDLSCTDASLLSSCQKTFHQEAHSFFSSICRSS